MVDVNRESQELYFNKLARRNVCDGVLYEPRLFFDDFTVPINSLQIVNQHPGSFRNGESYPVRIRYITAIMQRQDQPSPPVTPSPGDERLIQRYGMRIRAYDTFYMGHDHIPIPLWHNCRVAGPPATTRGTAVWQFDHRVPLGQRDTFVINALLFQDPAPDTRGVEVAFTGVNRGSRSPHLFASREVMTGVAPQQLDVNDFRNAGVEVCDLTQLSIFVESVSDDSNPAGNVQEAMLQIQQIGGTGRNWAITDPALQQFAPVGLWGRSVGRAVVHELPGDGWVWEPGQGVTVEILPFATRTVQERIWIGMLGEVIVT